MINNAKVESPNFYVTASEIATGGHIVDVSRRVRAIVKLTDCYVTAGTWPGSAKTIINYDPTSLPTAGQVAVMSPTKLYFGDTISAGNFISLSGVFL